MRTYAGPPWSIGPPVRRRRMLAPHLIDLLRHSDTDVAGLRLAGALGHDRSGRRRTPPLHLVDLLKDPDEDVRRAAAYALGQIGAEAKAACPSPRRVAQGPQLQRAPGRRGAGHRSGGEGRRPHLIDLLKDSDTDVRRAAAGAFGHTGGEGRPSLTSSRGRHPMGTWAGPLLMP